MQSGLPIVAADADVGPVAALAAIVAEHGADIVSRFYDTLLEDEEAKQFLSHSVVHSRLSKSLSAWLTSLLGEDDIRDSASLQEQQRIVGEVHARIKIPIHLVMRGAIVVKSQLMELLIERDRGTAVRAAQLANERVDTAIMLMSQAYVKDTTARARLDEAYRLFSLDQDVAIEKEAQRASLMEWSQSTLFTLLRDRAGGGLTRLSQSPFGLWVRHRAELVFEQSEPFHNLVAEMHRIDAVLLPQLEEANASNRQMIVLAELQASVDHVAFLLSDLFQTLTAMEGGRDPLTRALNRRFLPAILGREITLANEHGGPLSIILADVDHFKAINDRYGHQVGDVVLRQVAQVMMESVRPSDFVFRYGGEEFLVVLAETDVAEARRIADEIRAELAKRALDVSGVDALTVTASFGIAGHSGHPDQEYLIKAADDALYRAKANGRNRVELAPANT